MTSKKNNFVHLKLIM